MLGLAGRVGDIFNVTSRTAKGEETNQTEVLKGRDYVYGVAKRTGRKTKPAYAMSLRGDRYTPEAYAKQIESSIESDAKYLVTYFLRDENYIDNMRNFAREVMPSFT